MNNYAETGIGNLMVANGFDDILRWDGLTAQMEKAGLTAPTTTPVLAGTGSGSIVGDYYAYVRFVDRFGYVSNLSPISAKYTANGSQGAITDATNASPIVITSAGHGLATGAVVKIAGVGGNTSANNTWIITKIDADTFSLDDSHGTADYTGAGTWQSGVATISYSAIEVPTEAKVVRRQILRNTDGQTNTFYADIDTTDLTSATFTSTLSDTLLAGQTAQAILDSSGLPLANLHNPPPNHKTTIANHLSRMFLAGQYDEQRGMVQVVQGSGNVQGIGTDWVSGLEGRYLYVVEAVKAYQIDSVDTVNQTLTLTEVYTDGTDSFGVYAIRPAPAERRLVQYTPAGLPESWPPTYALQIQDDNDEITGLMARGSFLYVLENRHIYKCTFQSDPAVDGAIFLAANRGCVNNRCWTIIDNDAYMLDEFGIHKFGGDGTLQSLSTPIQELFRPNSFFKYHLNWKASRFFHCVVYRPQDTIRWFVSLAGSYLPKHAICFQYRLERWWIEEYRHGVGGGAAGNIDEVPQTFLGSEARKVYALWEGTTDVANPFTGTIRGQVTSPSGQLTLTDANANFSTSGVGSVVNAPVTIVDGTGKGAIRRVVSATSTVLTIDMPWLKTLDTSSVYQVGGINWDFKTSWLRYATSEKDANRGFEVLFSPTFSQCTMNARFRTDFASAADSLAVSRTSAQNSGVRTDAGLTDFVFDLTKPTGIVQQRLPGHKDTFLDGRRYTQLELSGVTNADPVAVFQITLDGMGNAATVSQQQGGGK